MGVSFFGFSATIASDAESGTLSFADHSASLP
jgi:hypothetical protein